MSEISRMINEGYHSGIDCPVNWHLTYKKEINIKEKKQENRLKAIQGILHHNENTKEEFKLPKNLIEQIRNSL